MTTTRSWEAGPPRVAGDLHRFLEGNPALVVVLDRAGRIVELNRAGAELLGVDPAGVRGVDWFGFVPPEIRAEVRRVFEAIMAGDQRTFASYENEVVTAGGERRTLLWRNALLADAAGAPEVAIATGIDLTARLELERRLTASEARSRELFAAMSEGFAVHELLLDAAGRPADYRFLQVNAAFERLTGLTAAAVVGRRAREVIPDLDAALVERYGRVALGGAPETFELSVDAVGRAFKVSAYRTQPGHFACIFSDVTDRVRAERALRHGEALYRTLFEATPSGVVLTDTTGHILAFNDAAATRLGYPRDEFARLGVWDIDADEDRAAAQARTRDIVRLGRVEFDARHRARDGSIREVHVKVVRVDRAEGPALLSTWDDLTEPRRLERELRLRLAERDENDHWLQASQRVAKLGHYVFDVTQDRWTSSRALDEIFGIGVDYRRDAAGWLALVHPDDRPAMQAYLGELLAGRPRFDRVYRVATADDAPRWVHGLGDMERDPAGRPLRLVGTIQDITSRRLAEQAQEALAEQLRQSQKLESIGRLAGGVAHDFNNILVVLLGCAEALHQSVAAGRPPEPEDVEELQEAALRAKDLTSQLLAFARKQVVAPVVLDVNAEVRRAERMLQRVLGEDVQLELRLSPDLWATTLDPGQLQQVLMNLAVNSRDAMPAGGRLVISTGNVTAPEPASAGWQGTPVAPGPQVRLLVEDSGQGIPPELWPRVFEPFVTTKPTGRGTGLGLATVYGIVQQSGAAVRFRSRPGHGTAFEILMAPAAGPAREAAPARAAPAPAPSQGERILLVEDDELVRATASRALRHAGYDVLVASSGAELLELMAGGLPAPRLLLTDVVMPGMNGRQVAEVARATWPGLKVLFMSGYAQDIIVHHGVVDAGLDLVEKPFTGEALVRRVRAALQG